MSLPVRGAGIEISCRIIYTGRKTSLPVRGAGIEIPVTVKITLNGAESLSVRGAGIEIL